MNVDARKGRTFSASENLNYTFITFEKNCGCELKQDQLSQRSSDKYRIIYQFNDRYSKVQSF